MVLDIFYIVAGAVLVLWGADKMTDGAVAVAERMGIPQIIIGLTIVAMGTSMPEFCVSLVSALRGTADLAVGNVVGSNVFNAMLIVGVAAAVAPITILQSTVRRDIPFALLASALLVAMCYDGTISRLDAAILFALFVVFMAFTIMGAKNSAPDSSAKKKGYTMLRSLLLVAIGLACLIFGSNLFVEGARSVATSLGVSEAVVGLTIVAMGTSLPELATSVVAARKGNSGIAIGNVLGSNVFNILFILGTTGLISPMTISGITVLDLSMLIVSMGLLYLFSFTKLTISRWEGWVLTLIFCGYIWWII